MPAREDVESSTSVATVNLLETRLRSKLELQRTSFDLALETMIATDAPYCHPNLLGVSECCKSCAACPPHL